MSARALLSDLLERDVAVTVKGEQLQIDAPRGVLTEELRRRLSEQKTEIVKLIRDPLPAPNDGACRQSVRSDRLEKMTLDEFAEAGLIVRIWSCALDSQVLLVSDDVPDTALAGVDLPVYRVSEMRKLATLRPTKHTLKAINEVKTIFGGTITDVQPRGNHD